MLNRICALTFCFFAHSAFATTTIFSPCLNQIVDHEAYVAKRSPDLNSAACARKKAPVVAALQVLCNADESDISPRYKLNLDFHSQIDELYRRASSDEQGNLDLQTARRIQNMYDGLFRYGCENSVRDAVNALGENFDCHP